MKGHTKFVLGLFVVGVIFIIGYKFVSPLLEDDAQRSTSDAIATKGTIRIGVDNWIGYYPLCSDEMRKRMRRAGYVLQCEDDKADYAERMKKLKKGKLQFAVATVDSYLLNGADVKYPGTIIAVIDESKGGDAIVAWSDKADNLDALKAKQDIKIALTPDSPSDHLLKSVAVHFDVPFLRNKQGSWRVPANGSEDALKKLTDKKVDVAVLWEPDVSRALGKKGIKKLLGTEQTNKLIVDILIVERDYAQDHPAEVEILLQNYFRTLKHYQSDTDALARDAARETGLPEKTVRTLLGGVNWINLSDNSLAWFGVNSAGGKSREDLVDTIESTANILIDSGDFSSSPIPNNDPYRLTNSRFIGDLFEKSFTTEGQFGKSGTGSNQVTVTENSLEREFRQLTTAQWSKLREIGTLKIRPIVFQSGTADLTQEGKQQIDRAVENLKHYPNFRVVVKGHTGTKGDKRANNTLSLDRAEAVSRYLLVTYNISTNRLRAVGYGGSKPPARQKGESSRSYNYRLPRVELVLVAENI
ncbi:MAG: phosphate ABC transporter substrate-binding/OmpA family protein [Gammaproteobacteria bacterium]|nr:phosphate ABC transporter substrate-binding/OmpA family protein [Gammaproteobacteria bacterium]MDH5651978.1 phosphate ABC transporter substrate-binding/OmpA family protein [Gammaproteobacteria bacterium]